MENMLVLVAGEHPNSIMLPMSSCVSYFCMVSGSKTLVVEIIGRKASIKWEKDVAIPTGSM